MKNNNVVVFIIRFLSTSIGYHVGMDLEPFYHFSSPLRKWLWIVHAPKSNYAPPFPIRSSFLKSTRFIPIVAYVRIIQKYLNLYVGVYVLKGLLSFIKRATSLSCCDINHHCWLCHQNMYLLVIICVKNSHLFALIGHFSYIIRLSMLAQVHNLVN